MSAGGGLGRRDFLKVTAGAGLWLAVSAPGRVAAVSPAAASPASFSPSAWLQVAGDGQVTVYLAKSEMGQGSYTGMAVLVAEELEADWKKVKVVQADADVRFGSMSTGGSSSVRRSWEPLRKAGAAAREMLVAAAARRWKVEPAACRAEAGAVVHAASGRRLEYGALAADAARETAPESPALKGPKEWKLIGKRVPRLDTPDKVRGKAVFGLDVRVPGLLHAVVARPPVRGGSVKAHDAAAARRVPGVRQVVAVPSGVAVVAETTWAALKGREQLAVTFEAGPNGALDSSAVSRLLAAAPLDPDPARSEGDVERALAGAARRVEAVYELPFLAHATMEPMNCTVQFKDGAATVWVSTQVPGMARSAAAKVLGIAAEKVDVQVTLLGGGFGRRLEVDFVSQAAAIAREAGGAPVQTLWSREQDMTHDFYRPACVSRFKAGFDAAGNLTAWHNTSAGQAIVPQVLKRAFGLPGAGPDKTASEGAFDQAYEWPNARIGHEIVDLPVPVGFWRSVGHSHQAFFKEGFIDEAAAAAGKDPVAFRAALLARHPRHLRVLKRAAELSGWGQALLPAADGAKRARGVALHQSFGSVVAQVAEVSLGPDKRIRVHRVVCVIDCGFPVNPNLIRQQMESGIVFGLSAALYGEISIAKGQVQQSNYHDYPVLRTAECPVIETDIIPSREHPEGVGEPGTPPIAPAVANALFALTGQRLRTLPLKLV